MATEKEIEKIELLINSKWGTDAVHRLVAETVADYVEDERWRVLREHEALDEGGLPFHLPMGVTENGEGPAEPDEYMVRCWCGRGDACMWNLAFERSDNLAWMRGYIAALDAVSSDMEKRNAWYADGFDVKNLKLEALRRSRRE